jgi:hypothetical protein
MLAVDDMGADLAFTGLRGRVLGALLQWPLVRFHRLQRGFVEQPGEYRRFLFEVIGPRLAETPGRVGVFGCGEHSRVLLASIPALHERVHCFTDNNAALWQQERFGRRVLPPAEAITACELFVLSTAVFQHVLRADLRRLGFSGPVIAMDDEVPPSWFLDGGVE